MGDLLKNVPNGLKLEDQKPNSSSSTETNNYSVAEILVEKGNIIRGSITGSKSTGRKVEIIAGNYVENGPGAEKIPEGNELSSENMRGRQIQTDIQTPENVVPVARVLVKDGNIENTEITGSESVGRSVVMKGGTYYEKITENPGTDTSQDHKS